MGLVGDILVVLASIVSMIVLSTWLFWPRGNKLIPTAAGGDWNCP